MICRPKAPKALPELRGLQSPRCVLCFVRPVRQPLHLFWYVASSWCLQGFPLPDIGTQQVGWCRFPFCIFEFPESASARIKGPRGRIKPLRALAGVVFQTLYKPVSSDKIHFMASKSILHPRVRSSNQPTVSKGPQHAQSEAKRL